MPTENLDITQTIQSRRDALEESLREITVPELRALKETIFPLVDHPWLEKFAEIVNDPTSGRFYHGMADHRIHVLYCRDKIIGMWFIQGVGKGPLQPAELKTIREILESRS